MYLISCRLMLTITVISLALIFPKFWWEERKLLERDFHFFQK